MQPPRFKRLTLEDFPGAPAWMETLITILNEVLGGTVDALSHRLSRGDNFLSGEKLNVSFTTDGTGATPALLAVKNELPFRPKHCWATKLERVDGAAITAAWSLTWTLDQNNTIRLKLQGLPASTQFRLNLVYE